VLRLSPLVPRSLHPALRRQLAVVRAAGEQLVLLPVLQPHAHELPRLWAV
jgi:hypothetical protein